MNVDTVIVGAGPYGLSLAAHLAGAGVKFRIFGSPMQTWHKHMPKGMLLKSEGFASSLYDPESNFTLRHYCREMQIPYEGVGTPVPLEVFLAYGLEFQKRLVPMLEETDITSVIRHSDGFELQADNGQIVQARNVILATGVTHFSFLPPVIAALPEAYASHAAKYHDLSGFRGKTVAVVGGGASAIDVAAVLHEEGAQVHLVARRSQINFHSKAKEPRPLHQRVRYPRSGLGIGWSSRLCADFPLLFHYLPQGFRLRFVKDHLGPAPGWFVRDKIVGKVPFHLDSTVQAATIENGRVRLSILGKNNTESELMVDHVIGATGYRTSIARMGFVEEAIRRQIDLVEDTPILSSHFETTVPGLYMVGLAASNSFGPLGRFAVGAKFASRRISKHIAAKARVSASARVRNQAVIAASR